MTTILCPYHQETRPSMKIYEDHAYCYGCGKYVTHLDLAFRLGLGMKGYMLIKSLSSPDPEKEYRAWVPWPPERTDWNTKPSKYGKGYMLWRGFTPETLSSLGIEYWYGWILFPSVVRPHVRRRGRVAQIRQSWENGEYKSVGPRGYYGRVVIEPECPKGTLYVEGPMDAIWIWQCSNPGLRKVLRVAALCAPPKQIPTDTKAFLWPDSDLGGKQYSSVATEEVRILSSDYEDPAATPEEVTKKILEEVQECL